MVPLKQTVLAATLAFSCISQGVYATAANDSGYTKNGLTWGSGLRMNQIQIIGTHNSYHREVSLEERPYHAVLLSDPENYYYSHSALNLQAEYQNVRSFEIDIWADPEGGKYATPLVRKLAHLPFPSDPAMNKSGTKVIHVPDADVGTTCHTFIECLNVIRKWSKAHPNHVPIPCMIEFKTSGDLSSLGGATPLQWNDTELLASLDAEFRSVFAGDELITPDDIRRGNLTLEESVLTYGWPELESARGRVMFMMDDGATTLGATRAAYIEGRPNLEGRVVFSQSQPGEPDCAFRKMNTPTGDYHQEIQDSVKKNYWVRTRADIPITTILSNDTTSRRDAAFSSGAQMVTTDWPAYGMSARYDVDYVVRFADGGPARCNPINAPESCKEIEFEPIL
ncbi:putative acid phosphatase [Phaeomoniella chlamydospora]|uniref:Putative acid phosphatase n=1 Tax=Phaeomoniella chlamydospora TaxID=158046 RepID=A0A0G2GPF0_PHACM|nr:putative acid phosphatase [Phaeomoniella chlamydospora]